MMSKHFLPHIGEMVNKLLNRRLLICYDRNNSWTGGFLYRFLTIFNVETGYFGMDFTKFFP